MRQHYLGVSNLVVKGPSLFQQITEELLVKLVDWTPRKELLIEMTEQFGCSEHTVCKAANELGVLSRLKPAADRRHNEVVWRLP